MVVRLPPTVPGVNGMEMYAPCLEAPEHRGHVEES
jgi:hypothetical protein